MESAGLENCANIMTRYILHSYLQLLQIILSYNTIDQDNNTLASDVFLLPGQMLLLLLPQPFPSPTRIIFEEDEDDH